MTKYIKIQTPEMVMRLELQDAINRVRELHKPYIYGNADGSSCSACDNEYPCPTIKALDGETK